MSKTTFITVVESGPEQSVVVFTPDCGAIEWKDFLFDKTLRKWNKKSTFTADPQEPKSGPGAGGAKMQPVQVAHVKVDGATNMEASVPV